MMESSIKTSILVKLIELLLELLLTDIYFLFWRIVNFKTLTLFMKLNVLIGKGRDCQISMTAQIWPLCPTYITKMYLVHNNEAAES